MLPLKEQISLTIDLWNSIAQEFIPIIGKEGFSALYARNLYLTQLTFPWLSAGNEEEVFDGFLSLKACLEEKSPAQSYEASALLLQKFRELLFILIGESLTISLLQKAEQTQLVVKKSKESSDE